MDLSQVGPPLRTLQLPPHKHFTHVGHVLEELVEQLKVPVIPTLSGGTTGSPSSRLEKARNL